MKVVKFYAGWCAPCTVYAPTFEQAQDELGFQYPQIQWESWNVDVVDPAAYDVHALPTTLVLDDAGVEVARGLGVMSLEDLVELIMNAYTESMVEKEVEVASETSNDDVAVESEESEWQ